MRLPLDYCAKVPDMRQGWADFRYFSKELVELFSYKYPLPPSFFTLLFAARLLVDRFVSVLCVSVLPEEELLRFRFKEVTFGYLAFLIRHYVARLLFRITSYSCQLSYAFKSCLSQHFVNLALLRCMRLYSELGDLKESLIVVRVGEQADNGEKIRFFLKTEERMYGLETGRTSQSVTANVWPQAQTYSQSVIREFHFYQLSNSSCFSYSKLL